MNGLQLETRQPARDRWRVEMVEQRTEGGLVLFEYAIREPGKNPFLLNNHRAQLREQHQRIVTGPKGGFMHVSGIEVLPDEIVNEIYAHPPNQPWVRTADGTVVRGD